jgi:threonine synthase
MKAAETAAGSKLTQRCLRCGAVTPRVYLPKCPACGGLIEITYDLSAARLRDSDEPLERYFDLLPLLDRDGVLTWGEGSTDCVHAERLGRSLGLSRVYLKLESQNPTGTTKDRMAAVVLSMFRELGIREFVSCSTGNSSNALAHGIQKHPSFRMHLFVGEAFADRLRYPSPAVEVHVVPDNFSEAFDSAVRFARERGLPFEGGFFNPARREGLKLAYLEAVDQIGTGIDWYVQAVSSAMGVYGTAKAARELRAMGRIRKLPRMVCVQQESCAPIVAAFREGARAIAERHIVRDPDGIAKAILRGNPTDSYPYVHDVLVETKGLAIAVSEAEILHARCELQAVEGVDCGFCGAATLAALRRLAEEKLLDAGDCVLLNLTD